MQYIFGVCLHRQRLAVAWRLAVFVFSIWWPLVMELEFITGLSRLKDLGHLECSGIFEHVIAANSPSISFSSSGSHGSTEVRKLIETDNYTLDLWQSALKELFSVDVPAALLFMQNLGLEKLGLEKYCKIMDIIFSVELQLEAAPQLMYTLLLPALKKGNSTRGMMALLIDISTRHPMLLAGAIAQLLSQKQPDEVIDLIIRVSKETSAQFCFCLFDEIMQKGSIASDSNNYSLLQSLISGSKSYMCHLGTEELHCFYLNVTTKLHGIIDQNVPLTSILLMIVGTTGKIPDASTVAIEEMAQANNTFLKSKLIRMIQHVPKIYAPCC
eukprot:TRINITY_DN6390_c0_g1_i1.p1 TRINITY_DN6390_c0_g1~~TRINITY_DN6390_c0_g1_i1.p1  ORF type:complete len:327 (+),score=40.33 TRINITY_DN6390_c0_g1_i1:571-1551(+)